MEIKRDRLSAVNIITRLDKGGSSEVFEEWVSELSHIGYKINVIFGKGLNTDTSIIEKFKKNKINYYCIKYLKREISFVNDILSFFCILYYLYMLKPDIIHLHTSKAGFIGRIAASLYRKKNRLIIYTSHGHIFHGYFEKKWVVIFSFFERLASIFTDFITSLTIDEMNAFKNKKIFPKKCYVELPCGIDIKNIKYKELNDIKNIGYMGRFSNIKGPDLFINAALKLKNNNFNFYLFGSGEESEKLKKMSSKEVNIFFYDFMDFKSMFDKIDLLIVPSRNEGLGRIILYAGLYFVPVLGSNTGGIPEVLDYGRAGYLFENENIDDLAEKIIYIKNNIFETNKKIKLFNERVRKHYSLEKTIKLIDEMYIQLKTLF